MTKQLVRFGTAILTTLLVLVVLWRFRMVVVVLLASLALAAAVRPLAKHWARQRLAVRLALILLFLVALGSLGLGLFLVGGSAIREIRLMAQAASVQGEWRLPEWLAGSPFSQALVARLPTPNKLLEAVTGDQGQRVLAPLLGFTQGIGSVVTGGLVVLFLSLYWSSSQIHFERLWLSLLPPARRSQVRGIWRTIELDTGAYIRSQVAQSLLAGLLLGLGYWALGSPYSTLLALTGALACLIPVVGAPLALLAPLFVGLLTGVQLGLLTVLYTLIVLIALGVWVKPRLYKRRWDNPILTVVLVIALADAFGLLGILIAPPLSAVCQILWSNLVSRRAVSGSAARLSDLRERQAMLLAAIKVMDEPPVPLVTSSMERLTQLIERAEQVLQAALPAERSEPVHSPQPSTVEGGPRVPTEP
jgi:predicted PurR-regulated permease PerM